MDIVAYLIGLIPAFSALALLIPIALVTRNCYKNKSKAKGDTIVKVFGTATSLVLTLFIVFYVALIIKLS